MKSSSRYADGGPLAKALIRLNIPLPQLVDDVQSVIDALMITFRRSHAIQDLDDQSKEVVKFLEYVETAFAKKDALLAEAYDVLTSTSFTDTEDENDARRIDAITKKLERYTK